MTGAAFTPPDGLPEQGVAVVGMASRFPGAPDLEAFWRVLSEGREALTVFGDDELREAGVPEEQLRDPAYVAVRGLIDGPERFDAAFFGYTPREAELMDPQHRLLLECAWQALEDAGHDPRRFAGPVGVYAGCGSNTYLLHNLQSHRDRIESVGLYQAMLGSDKDFLATRLSYKLGLRGPALTVQTACSTSLVAVHLAVQSLLSGECDMAVAGGARISVPQRSGYLYQPDGIFSPDGHCRPFDARARGCVEGDGVGVVVLRRLADAVADGDPVRAVILGSAVNNDGAGKVGYTAPGVDGQAEAIALAQALAGVEPESVSYVEAHGTATRLGDPIEVEALVRAFGTGSGVRCALGSVKGNFGHLDAAAGVASLIKTVLALEHRKLPPSLHFEEPNPEIDFGDGRFHVNSELRDWTSDGAPRRAGVSSFGIGGTNAHVVLEEAPETPSGDPPRPWELLVLSAAGEEPLEAATRRLADHLGRRPDLPLADVAHTLQAGRRQLRHRRIAFCRSTEDAASALSELDPRRVLSRVVAAEGRKVAFLFPGQGTQHPGMGRELYESEPGFRRRVDRCAEILAPHLGLDLRSVLFAEGEEGAERLEATALAQPALFVVEHSLARLWMDWGVVPEALLGHSVGEYVAAALAGVFSLEDALRVVAARGRLMQELPSGSMLSVPLPEAEVRELVEGREGLSLAAVNGPSFCVVSGPDDPIAALAAELAGRGVEVRRLHTSHAFHSAMMDPAVEALAQELAGVSLAPPELPFVSNRTGTWIRPEEAADPGYWARHLRETVRFGDGVETLLGSARGALLEVGPGRSLASLVRRQGEAARGRTVLSCLPSPRSETSAAESLARTLGQAWLAGVEIDWAGYQEGRRRRRVPLPGYPFAGRRYWLEAVGAGGSGRPPGGETAAGRLPLDRWLHVPLWRQALPVAPVGDLSEDGTWLVITAGGPFSRRWIEGLRGRVARVVTAGPAGAVGESDHELHLGEADDLEALLDRLSAEDPPVRRIVDLLPLTVDGGPGEAAAPPDPLERGHFRHVLALARALARRPAGAPLDVTVVSDGLHGIGAERPDPAKSLLLGPILSLSQEARGVSCRSVDLGALPVGGRSGDLLGDRLIDEAAGASAERLVAYRGTARWLPSFERVETGPADGASPQLREEGVYLVTGGLGGVGLELAEHLARSVRARLVLVGRSALPSREDWPEVARTTPEDDPVGAVVRRLLAVEKAGGRALPIQADVADPDAMAEAVRLAREAFGGIHGAIHAAGVAGGRLLELQELAEAERVLRPKVAGTLVLDRALDGEEVDFLLLCSSLNALLGGPGQAVYASANAFLDAHASAAAADGRPVIAVDWDAWLGVGMAAGGSPAPAAGDDDLAADEPFDHPLLTRRGRGPAGEEVFAGELDPVSSWILDEHRLGGHPVVPGTAYLEMARAAGRACTGSAAVEARDVLFVAPMRVDDGARREVHAVLRPREDGYDFTIRSRPAGGGAGQPWQVHATGAVGLLDGAAPARVAPAELLKRCGGGEGRPMEDDYREELRRMGLGPRWDVLRTVWQGHGGEVVGLLELAPDLAADLEVLELHPALLDVATSFAEAYAEREEGYYLPLSYGRLRIYGPLPRRLYAHARPRPPGSPSGSRETLSFDVSLLDEVGEERLAVERFTLKRVGDVARTIRGHDLRSREADAEGAARPAEGMSAAEGVQVFDRVLALRGFPRVAVSTRDLAVVLDEARALTAERVAEAMAGRPGLQDGGHPRPDLETAYVEPRSELEGALAEIWQEVLGIDRVGVHDDFFELGGHSLLGTQLVSRVRSRLGVELAIDRLFESPTVAGLATAAEEVGDAPGLPALEPIPRLDPSGELPLSYPQERLWFLDRLDPGNAFYNVSQAVRLGGDLDLPALAAAVRGVVRRHAVLRTSFRSRRGRPYQRILSALGVPLPLVDLSALPADRRQGLAERLAVDLTRTAFDLPTPPHFGLRLMRLAADHHVLALSFHHAVADGWSVVVLIREVAELYRARITGSASELPELPIQYADFAAWQRRSLEEGAALERQLAYWRERLARPLPRLELPTDRPRHGDRSFRGASETLKLPADLTRRLKARAAEQGATPFTVLLSTFALVLAGESGQDELLIGSPMAGRTRTELEPLIGMFLNVLPLRIDLRGEVPYRELLARTRRVTVEAYANQDVPLEKVLEELDLDRSGGRPPLFQVLFNMQDFPNRRFELPGLTLTSMHLRDVPSKFELTVYAAEVEGEILFELVYDTDLFDTERILGLLDRFRRTVEEAVSEPERSIRELAPGVGTSPRPSEPVADGKRSDTAKVERLKAIRRRVVAPGEVETGGIDA